MKTIPTTFTQSGYVFTQLERKGDVALFHRQKPGHSCPIYEAVVIQKLPQKIIMGKQYETRESMPTNESWGTLGFSYLDLERAKIGFEGLCKAHPIAFFDTTSD